MLLYGFAASIGIHVLFRFILYRSTATLRHYVYFFATEALALGLATQLRSMAAGGDDLAQQGLTA